MARIADFGSTNDGQTVQAITLQAGDVTATILTLGAIVQDVTLAGVGYGLTLGSDRVADYEGAMRHHGSLIGPVANRLTGARATIAGTPAKFEANQDGTITLHSGSVGTHLKVWALDHAAADTCTLSLVLPDGEGGFPGRRHVTARFTALPPATLRLEVAVTTDAPTLINFANHSYWNLDGRPDWAGHRLQITADHYLPTTDAFTPTGQIVPVAGTAMDFRTARAVAPHECAFDTNFCLSDQRQPLRDVLVLTGASGVQMTLATTEPGVQVYDGRNAIRPGRDAYEGLAIEAQFWPDAPANPAFPDITLHPGQDWLQVTEWRFARG